MSNAVVIGNIALDETLSVADFPKPGASIFGVALSRDLGGKGANQAIVMSRTGLGCTFVGAVGRDPRGEEITARLKRERLTAELIPLDGVASDLSVILMAEQGENAVVTTREAADAVSPKHVRRALSGAKIGDLLVMQGNLGAMTTAEAMRFARGRGLRTAFNPSPLQPYFDDIWSFVDIAFVNAGEAEALGGVDALLAQGVRDVVLTRGGGGAALIRREEVIEVPAVPCDIVDTTGAGDCFMAVALASAALRNVDMDVRALSHAAKAAAHTVSRPGTVAAFPDEVTMSAILAG